MKRWWLIPLTLFLLSFTLRSLGALQLPSPYWEEVALGYDAYSILKTGKDHHGNPYPLLAFPSFGDYKPSLYFYALTPSITLFGLTPFAVRLPAILASSLTVGLWWWLMKRWTNARTAWWSGILLAVQPWSWQVGQAGFETNLATTLYFGTLVAFFLWSDTKTKHWRYLVLSSLLAGLSLYAYHGARIWIPTAGLVLATSWLWPQPHKQLQKHWKHLVLPIVIFTVIALPLLSFLRSPLVSQRFQETSIFTDGTLREERDTLRASAPTSLIGKVVTHRALFWGKVLLKNYLDHFAPGFLFLDGETNPRHTSQYVGALYIWESLSIVLALGWGWRQFRTKKDAATFLALLLTVPLAAMLTKATPHALRALPLACFLAGLSGIGISQLYAFFPRNSKLITGLMGSTLILSVAILGFYLFQVYPQRTAQEWQYGYQELFTILVQNKQEHEPVYVSRIIGRPAMYLFFTQKIAPQRVQAFQLQARFDQQEFLTFEDWTFHDGENFSRGLHAVTKLEEVPQNVHLLQTVVGKNNQPVWYIFRRE